MLFRSKVQKNTLNGHIQESGDSEYRKPPTNLDSHTVLPTVNLNSEKTSAVQVSPKYYGEYGNVLSKYSKQKSHDFWNRRDSHDPPTRVRVKQGSNRSQYMRDDNSGWSLDGETLHIRHRDATNTGTYFEEMKKWCCCSEISIQSCQEGTLDLSCQTNPLRRFPAEDSNILHQYAEKHNTD